MTASSDDGIHISSTDEMAVLSEKAGLIEALLGLLTVDIPSGLNLASIMFVLSLAVFLVALDNIVATYNPAYHGRHLVWLNLLTDNSTFTSTSSSSACLPFYILIFVPSSAVPHSLQRHSRQPSDCRIRYCRHRLRGINHHRSSSCLIHGRTDGSIRGSRACAPCER